MIKQKKEKNTILSQSLDLHQTTSTKTAFIDLIENEFNDKFSNKKQSYSFVLFHIDLIKRNIDLKRIGSDLKNLQIDSKLNGKYGYGLQNQQIKQTIDLNNI